MIFNKTHTPLHISLALLTYFILLMLVNVFKWDFVLIGVFVELLTLPALAGVVGLLGYSLYRSFAGAEKERGIYLKAAGVLMLCVVMLAGATFYFG